MAAILKLRRGASASSLVESELFYNTSLSTLQVGKSSGIITLVKLNEINTGGLQIVGTISGSNLTLNGDITAQNAYFRGDVRLDGQIILGDVPQDNINVNAQFSGSLIPSASNFDLGSETKKWNNVYANSLYGNVTDSNLLHFTQSTNNFTSSQETKNNTLGDYTSSIDTKFVTLGTYTSSIDTKFVTLGTYTASLETKNNTLGTYTASLETKNNTLGGYTSSIDTKFNTLGDYTSSVSSSLYLLNDFTSSQNTQNSTLASYTGSVTNSIVELYATTSDHETRIAYLSASFSQSVDSRLDQLETNSGSVNNSISLLNDFTSSQETKNSTLGTYTGSVNNQITELFSTASDHETRIDGIQDYTSSLRTAIGVSGTNVTINGDLSVLGTTTQINSTQVNIGENILELNYGGSATTAGIITKDATGASTISGSLLWDATNDYWKGGKLGSESKLLVKDGDNVVSSSAQINLVDTADYVSAIKNRLNIESVVSSSIQVDVYNTTNFTSYSQSVDTRLVQLSNDSGSQNERLNNLELFTSSQESKNITLGTYTGSNDDKWSVLGSVTASLINATSSYETKGNGIVSGSSQVTTSLDLRYELQGRNIASGSSQFTSSYDTRYELQGRNIVSGSDQVTSSLDLRYANSSSFHNLVGAWDFGTQGSIRDAAFYNVTSSVDIVLASGSINYNNNHLLTAGATKKYIDWRTDEILSAIAVADITSVTTTDGLSGGAITGDVTLSLDTASATFRNGVKTKMNIDGVISGSSQVTLESTTFTDGAIKTFLQTDGIGNLSFQHVETTFASFYAGESVPKGTPLYFSGSNGSNPKAYAADASNPAKMPVVLIANDNLTAGNTYDGIILGLIEGMDLTGYTAGTTVYAAEGGGWSTHLPSGSNSITQVLGIVTKGGNGGKGLVLNPGPAQLPGLQHGYAWVGSVTNQPIAVSTSSFVDLSSLNTFTSSINTTIKTKLNVEGVISGSSQLSGTTIQNLSGSFTGSFNGPLTGVAQYASNIALLTDNTDTTLYPVFSANVAANGYTTLRGNTSGSLYYNSVTQKLYGSSFVGSIEANNGVVSGSSQIISILDPINTFTASQETKNLTLATYTGSVDSSISQLNAVSHSHSNKANLDTINQNLATTSDVNFGSLHTSGTGSIGTNLTVYGDLTVFGTQSIINSENLAVSDNLIYLNNGSEITNPDLGIVGNYNDGTYAHTGIFSDASDSQTWKVFKGYTIEPSGSIDTSDASFTLADFKAANFTGTSFTGIINSTNGVVSGSSQIDLTQTTNYTSGIKTQLNANTVVSGSSQIDATTTTNFATGVKTQLNSNTVISGSSQISGIGNSQLTNNSITIAGTLVSLGSSISLATITNGSGIVSGSSQITLSSTTGGGTTANVQFGSLGIGMAASGTTGRIDATNDIVAYSSSDRRFKDNITPIQNALDKINKIGGYEFDWKEENKIEHGYEGHDLGVIAQEIEEIAPELVQTRENGYKAVKYDKLVSVLIQAVKELSAKVNELENK